MRRSWRGAMLLVIAAGTACRPAPPPASTVQPVLPRIPRDAPRFEIDSVTDSTASFRVQEARWILPGLSSYVVDPQQRDALVARLRIISRDSLTATALITSQVARVKAEHFLLVVHPPRPWWREQTFWAGILSGVLLGVSGGLVVR